MPWTHPLHIPKHLFHPASSGLFSFKLEDGVVLKLFKYYKHPFIKSLRKESGVDVYGESGDGKHFSLFSFYLFIRNKWKCVSGSITERLAALSLGIIVGKHGIRQKVRSWVLSEPWNCKSAAHNYRYGADNVWEYVQVFVQVAYQIKPNFKCLICHSLMNYGM